MLREAERQHRDRVAPEDLVPPLAPQPQQNQECLQTEDKVLPEGAEQEVLPKGTGSLYRGW